MPANGSQMDNYAAGFPFVAPETGQTIDRFGLLGPTRKNLQEFPPFSGRGWVYQGGGSLQRCFSTLTFPRWGLPLICVDLLDIQVAQHDPIDLPVVFFVQDAELALVWSIACR